jgi:hypothetical protein
VFLADSLEHFFGFPATTSGAAHAWKAHACKLELDLGLCQYFFCFKAVGIYVLRKLHFDIRCASDFGSFP